MNLTPDMSAYAWAADRLADEHASAFGRVVATQVSRGDLMLLPCDIDGALEIRAAQLEHHHAARAALVAHYCSHAAS